MQTRTHNFCMAENFLFRWLPVLLWAIVIFGISSNPDPYQPLPAGWAIAAVPAPSEAGPKRINADEMLGRFSHAAEYLVLAVLTARALVWRGDLRLARLAIAFGTGALYAISDEIHQLFVPGRAFEWSDLALDLGGCAIGLITYAFIRIFWKRRVRLS